MILHRDLMDESTCGGQVADHSGDSHKLFGTDYWCVYCGQKWSKCPTCERTFDPWDGTHRPCY